MQVNSVNNYQNFNGRFATAAAKHLKRNAGHYCINGGAFATAALTGNLNSIDGVVRTKLFADAAEVLLPIVMNSRRVAGLNGFARPCRPKTNVFIWMANEAEKIGRSIKMAFVK